MTVPSWAPPKCMRYNADDQYQQSSYAICHLDRQKPTTRIYMSVDPVFSRNILVPFHRSIIFRVHRRHWILEVVLNLSVNFNDRWFQLRSHSFRVLHLIDLDLLMKGVVSVAFLVQVPVFSVIFSIAMISNIRSGFFEDLAFRSSVSKDAASSITDPVDR